jgi:hypothetical protein
LSRFAGSLDRFPTPVVEEKKNQQDANYTAWPIEWCNKNPAVGRIDIYI